MNDCLESDYLSRPLILDMAYVITNTQVSIKSPSTIFVQATLPGQLQKKELLAIYEHILKITRARKIRVSYRQHYRKTITERWEEYEADYVKGKELFGELTAQARVVRKRGIHYGCSQDTELKKLYDLNEKVTAITSRGVIGIMSGIRHDLTHLDRELTPPSSQCRMITL